MIKYYFPFLILVTFFAGNSCERDRLRYKNPDLPVEERVEDLLLRMTPEEKFWQLFMIPGDLSDGKERYKNGIFGFQVSAKGKSNDAAGQILEYSADQTAVETANLINSIQKYFVEETRLGIPVIPFDEALHGLVRGGATAFPQSIGLAATWDTVLMGEVAEAIAMETKSRGLRQILSPVLNIARDVRWGRTEETYGEDPFLVSRMAVAFISRFEKNGVITTPKHFVANLGDGGRDSYPVQFNERLLEEVYFPAFKAAFLEAGAWSVMTSYNSLNGRPCTANDWLLNKKLKDEWGFRGFVISDANAVGGANVLHYTATGYSDAGEQAIENGLDVIFQTSYDHYPLYYEAFEKGLVDEAAIDEAVRRVLRAKFMLGLFEDPYIDTEDAARWNGNPAHREIAKKAALESIVLLKNDGDILPLSREIKTIAVIGTDATEARLGGYSGPGIEPVSILEGLEKRGANSVAIRYAQGCGRESEEFRVIQPERLSAKIEGEVREGLKGEYFNNINMEGEPVMTRVDRQLHFNWTLYSPEHEKINYDFYSVRWTGTLTAPETGTFRIGFRGNDGYRLYIDNELVIDNWKKQMVETVTVPYNFIREREYDIKIEFFESAGNVRLSFIWDAGVKDDHRQKISEAVNIARVSDIAIIVAGITEGESQDRALLVLPGFQEEMIKQVAATGTPVVVVLVAGSAVVMENWIDAAEAIVDVWYPGEEGGNAVAEVLFGDYSPAGRLPITFPVSEGQLPLVYNNKPTGRIDDYVNLTGHPLFPFGYGLSYTSFEYSDMKFSSGELSSTDTIDLHFTLTNSGSFEGDEVVQLYIRDLIATVAQPVIELRGFQRVHLLPGESREVIFKITPELLSMLDIDLNRVVEPGEFRIMVGASCKDIRLRGIIKVKD